MGRGTDRADVVGIVVASIAISVVGGAVVLFSFGEDLFGSSTATIDAYNRDALDSCDLPGSAVLVREFVAAITSVDGAAFRSLSRVYASTDRPETVAEALRVGTGFEDSGEPCALGNVPGVWVIASTDVDEPGDVVFAAFWREPDAIVISDTPIPASAVTLFRMSMAQRETAGWFR